MRWRRPAEVAVGVDALLLLSACAEDVQQKEEEEYSAPQKPPGLEVVAAAAEPQRRPNLRHHPQRPRRRVAHGHDCLSASGFNGLAAARYYWLRARTRADPTAVHDRMPSVDHGHDGSVLSGVTKEMPQAQGYPVEPQTRTRAESRTRSPGSMGSIDSTLSSVQLSSRRSAVR